MFFPVIMSTVSF